MSGQNRVIYYSEKEKMMKFEVQADNLNEEITYPCLLKSKKDPLVIFAPTKEENATVMVGNEGWEQGEYYGSFDEDGYELFRGSITLSN